MGPSLIFDTRFANLFFSDPPSTRLPTAGSLGRLESSSPSNYFSAGDIECAFYGFEIPQGIGDYLTLPSISAAVLGLDTIGGVKLPAGARIVPALTVLPMGWNWALSLCQAAMINAIKVSGVPCANIIADGKDAVRLTSPDDVAAAGYVDNFCVIGGHKPTVDSAAAAIRKQLRKWGLVVHEISLADLEGEFTGLDFCNGHILRVKRKRLLRLRQALSHLCKRQRASGTLMRVIIGHICWVCLLRRESLCLLDACYKFATAAGNRVIPFWKSVLFELDAIAGILPLIQTDISSVWHPTISCSDASLFGIGNCIKRVCPEVVGRVGRCSERWRYKHNNAIQARLHSLEEKDPRGF